MKSLEEISITSDQESSKVLSMIMNQII